MKATSYTNGRQEMRMAVDLPPGTNFVTMLWTNVGTGARDFWIQMESEDETVTNHVGEIRFYPWPVNGPEHHWLARDGEGASFYVVDAAGGAWVWGANQYGQLGVGFKSDAVTRPMLLPAPAGRKWRQFTYNSHSAVGITDDGFAYGMGSFNFSGKLTTALTPVFLDLGQFKRAALTESGFWKVDVWDTLIQLAGPIPAEGVSSTSEVAQLDGAPNRLLALRKHGRLDPEPRSYNGAALPLKAISTSRVHALVIDAEGQMFGWGENSNGQLPLKGISYVDLPTKAASPPGGGTWTKVCAGLNVSLAVDSDGRLYAWGRRGYTGTISFTNNQPTLVDVPAEEIGWLDLSVGSATGLALSARGNLYAWTAGEKPRKVEGLPPLTDSAAQANYVAFDVRSVRMTENLTMDLMSSGEANVTLQSSSDLVHWTTVTNVNSVAGKAGVTAPISSARHLFFRIHD